MAPGFLLDPGNWPENPNEINEPQLRRAAQLSKSGLTVRGIESEEHAPDPEVRDQRLHTANLLRRVGDVAVARISAASLANAPSTCAVVRLCR